MNQNSLVYISWLLIISAAVCRREAGRQNERDGQERQERQELQELQELQEPQERQERQERHEQRTRNLDRTGKEGYACHEGL